MSNKWTAERVDHLIDLYLAEKTYKEIADDMGTTESAITGKITKLIKVGALQSRNHRGKAAPKPAPKPKAEEKSDTLMLAARLIKTMEAGGMKLTGLEFSNAYMALHVGVEEYVKSV